MKKIHATLLFINLFLLNVCDANENRAYNDKITVENWKGSYLDKRENFIHGEVFNVNTLFVFMEEENCKIVLENKDELECSIVKDVSEEDMPMDETLKKEFQTMESMLVMHKDESNTTYKHYFFRDKNGDYSFASWYFTSPTNASVRFPLQKIDKKSTPCNNSMHIYEKIDCYEHLNRQLKSKLEKWKDDEYVHWRKNLKEKCEGVDKKSIESYQGSGVVQLEKALCYNKAYSSKLLSLEKKDKKALETEVTNVTCGTGGCVIYTQRIGSIEKINANTRRASYKVEKYTENKLQNKETMFIYAKCHKSKEHELSFDSPDDYKRVGEEWRYDFTRQNKKIAFDLCKEFSTPKFTDYSIESHYTNPNKPLIQKGFGRLYRTRLKKALKEKKPEFAGKHIIAQWGCDESKNECTTGGIIDASIGKAIEFPFKYYAHNGSKEIIYKLGSSLIVFAGDFEFKDGQKKKKKVLFYEFKDGEFLFLKALEYKK